MNPAKLAVLTVVILAPAFADDVPVAGSGSGTFSGVSGGSVDGSGDTWTYSGSRGSKSTLNFTGYSFGEFFLDQCFIACVTPVTVDLGTLTDTNNGRSDTKQDLTATLTIDVNFTTPGGGPAAFPLSIGIDESYNIFDFDSVVDLASFDGPSYSFVAGGEKYTVTLDGFYNGPFNLIGPLSTLVTANGFSNSADLYATITSTPTPEPASAVLLGTLLCMVGLSLRKRVWKP